MWNFKSKTKEESEEQVSLQEQYWKLKEHITLLKNELKVKEAAIVDEAHIQSLFRGNTATFPDGTKVSRVVTERVSGMRGKDLLEAVREFMDSPDDYIKESLDESKLVKSSKKYPNEFAELFTECGLDLEEITTYKIKK